MYSDLPGKISQRKPLGFAIRFQEFSQHARVITGVLRDVNKNLAFLFRLR